MNPSIRHQDSSRHLGVFLDSVLVELVPDVAERADFGQSFLKRVAAERGIAPSKLEILTVCRNHHRVPAVDCVDCVPLDS